MANEHHYSTREDSELLIGKLCELRGPGYGNAVYTLRDNVEAHVLYYINRTYDQVFKAEDGLDAPGLHIPHSVVLGSPRRFLRVYYVMDCGVVVATVIDTKLCNNGRCGAAYKTAGISTHNGAQLGDLLCLQYWEKCGDVSKWRQRSGSRKRHLVTKSSD